MKVSLVTPTKKREAFLLSLYELIKEQTHTEWEWLIHDSSERPSAIFANHPDQRIRYFYSETDFSIGEKRNALLKEVEGELIFHFDDDDFYAPNYLSAVLGLMKEYDFFSVHSWFAYDAKNGEYFYFRHDHPSQTHFELDALSGSRLREIDFGPMQRMERVAQVSRQGYGFTFAYRKCVAKACRFPDLDVGEDRGFFNEVERHEFRTLSMADHNGIAVKIVHDTNVGKVYPQYRLPPFLAEKQLPDFTTYLEHHEDRLSHCRQSI